MIKSDFGKITIKGNTPLLMAEFSSLINGLIKEGIFSKEQIEELVKKGMKTKEEINKEFYEKYKDGISTRKMQEYARAIVESRKSGLIKDEENSTEPKVRTIVDNDNLKVTEIRLSSNGKTQDEIEEELSNTFKKLFEEEDFDE